MDCCRSRFCVFHACQLAVILWISLLSFQVLAAEGGCAASLVLPANQWRQIALPCDAGSAATVSDLFSDDFSGTYREDWVIFGYDAGRKVYFDPGLTGHLEVGRSYWVTQLGPAPAVLTVNGAFPPEVTHGSDSACPDSGTRRCTEVGLTGGLGVTWNMAGSPLLATLDWQSMRVADVRGVCADSDGCSLAEARLQQVFYDQLWRYDPVAGGYERIEGHAPIRPWDGFWSAVLVGGDQPRLVAPIEYGGYRPADVGVAPFAEVDGRRWDEAAVRNVLRGVAYGGQATARQIEAWANESPRQAIIEMLSFDESNPLLSPPSPVDSARLDEKGGTLTALGDFWSSGNADNDVEQKYRHEYVTEDSTEVVRPFRLWERAVVSHGLNPFRQKLGVWETNDHMSVNIATAVTGRQALRYYDDVCDSLANPTRNYADTLATAALSAAIAKQYGHDKNVFRNGQCQCNEDFAREFHQLFFGILGHGETDYHETVSIKNTARALTDMRVYRDAATGKSSDVVTFGTANHFPGVLEILHTTIDGSRADERIGALAAVDIQHPESLDTLPVMMIRGLANDNLRTSDIDEIRTVWKNMPQKNLLRFLRGYAISRQFHDPARVKYFNSVDRNSALFMQTILNNHEIDIYHYGLRLYEQENVKLFFPRHNVFGGQTGLEAAASDDVFRFNYNRATRKFYHLYRYTDSGSGWNKDWSSVISPVDTNDYQVDKVGEFLWNRYVGDGLKHYGVLERTWVNSFLATNDDWAANVDRNDLGRVFSRSELLSDPVLVGLREAHASATMRLDDSNPSVRKVAMARIGKAVNFISATPWVFASQGGAQ